MSHPLLTKVLSEPLSARDAREVIDCIPPAIADLLERALDVCAYCHHERDHWEHLPSESDAAHRHAYQPLVAT